MKRHYPTFIKIKKIIDKADYILVITHQSPDGDGVGSLLALSHYLDGLNKKHVLFINDIFPDYLKFLPLSEKIVNEIKENELNDFDLIIILDSGDLDYAGVKKHIDSISDKQKVVNIDHHFSNILFGHINLVHGEASSTSEIIYHFFDFHNIPISKEIATCLLTGILTDTNNFSNMGTTPASLEIAAKLLNYGGRLRQISNNTIKNKSLSNLQLWGRALARLKKDEKTGLVTTILKQKDYEELGLDENNTEGIANFLNNIEDAKTIMVLREKNDGTIKASLRTTHPKVDVSEIARKFGGGGHKKAAGFSVKGKIVEAKNEWKVG